MYNFLTEAVKRRFILELRRYWAYHPKYREIVDHIQGKYSFRERPQYGIVLKTSSANHVQLSADNFQGTVMSYLHLAKFENKPGLSVEWVREDGVAIQKNNGEFPSAPGFYFIEVRKVEDPSPPYNVEPVYEFYVDPLLEVYNETATKVDDFTWMVSNAYVDGTTLVFEMPGSIQLVRGVNYTESPTTGEIKLTTPLPPGTYLSVDYRYQAPSTGPWRIKENFAHREAIPGAVLAFGRRIEDGDVLVVVVHSRRQPTALEYGGRWEISLDFDVVARDPYSQQEIVDNTVLYLWGIARNRLSTEGIEIMNVSMGGETEEVYDENADDYYYNASFTIQTMTDWSIHVPLSATIRRVSPQTVEQIEQTAGMTDDQLIEAAGLQNIRVVENLGLRTFDDPFFVGKSSTFETIK